MAKKKSSGIFGLPTWLVLGGGAAVVFFMMKKKAPAPAPAPLLNAASGTTQTIPTSEGVTKLAQETATTLVNKLF